MAFEVTKVYLERFPAMRLIGLRYTNDDRDGGGGFGTQWGEWMNGDLIGVLKNDVGIAPFDDSPLGLMTMRGDGSNFTYWIGLFFPAGTKVPNGYEYLDLPESNIGTGWIRGPMEELFGGPPHEAVCKRLGEENLGRHRTDIAAPGSDTYCFFERYHAERFDVPEENGYVTLDYGNYFV